MPRSPLACLIVEDQAPVAEALEVLFSLHDVPTRVAGDAAQALAVVRTGAVGVVLQDMNFAPGQTTGDEGAALFHAIRSVDPGMPVLLMTAFTSLERAVSLVKAGAVDYFGKPWDDARLVASVRALLDARQPRAQSHATDARAAAAGPDLRGIVFESAVMRRLVDLAVQVATADVPVLITGPNGVGKEKFAEIIQANSRRASRPFIAVNAGALPDSLLEAELFGVEAGAFTGAVRRRVGRFEAANGGTLFLDEIGTLSMQGQAKLLRVVQTGTFERLGSSTPARTDVRLLCATNVDLPDAIEAGQFREDLYFRLNVIELAIPPLRDRRDDILPIARSLLARHAPGGRRHALSAAAEETLLAHGWAGNVRELQNRLQRARLVAPADLLTPEDLGLGAGRDAALTARVSDDDGTERAALEELLRRHAGSVSRVAEVLGLSRQALYRRMEKHGVTLERRPRS